jgi:hypothetical protein
MIALLTVYRVLLQRVKFSSILAVLRTASMEFQIYTLTTLFFICYIIGMQMIKVKGIF